MQGTAAAPSASKRRASRSVKAGVPTSPTRTPANGSTGAAGAQSSSAAAAPTTMTAGACTRAARAFSAMSASVPRTVAGCGAFPPDTTAAGVSGGLPAAVSRAAICSRLFSPIKNTSVPCSAASASRDSGSVSPVCAVWPVMTWKLRLAPRCVTGMPAAAGTAMHEEIPGTSSQGTPAACSVRNSSPPRPNTNGSPPFRRTTVFPLWPSRTSRLLISLCGMECLPHRLPAGCCSACAACASRAGSMRSS